MPTKKPSKILRAAVAAKALARRGKKAKPAARAKRAAKPDFVTKAWEAAVEFTHDKKQELLGLLYSLSAVALFFALIPKEPNLLGIAGTHLFRLSFGAFGVMAVGLPVALAFAGFCHLMKLQIHAPSVKAVGWTLVAIAVCSLVNLVAPNAIEQGVAQGLYWGGLFGRLLGGAMLKYLASAGTVVLCLALLAISVYLLEQEGMVKMAFLQAYERLLIQSMGFKGSDAPVRARARKAKPEAEAFVEEEAEEIEEEISAPKRGRKTAAAVEEIVAEEAEETGTEDANNSDIKLISARDREGIAAKFLQQRQKIKVSQGGPRVNTQASTDALSGNGAISYSKLDDYQLPPLSLLKESNSVLSAPKDYEEISVNLERVLTSFGVAAKVVEVCPGPTVTRYEISLAPGVKMSRVVTLADDIALGAKVSSVRIEGPIPGKGTLGIEIPNAKPQAVFMRELVETEEFQSGGHKLVFAVGKDIGGSMIFSNLAEMPHLMVAGATGSGKSVCLNAIITSILFRAKPDEVKLLLIDPKRVELTPYDGVPHLMRPVVANPKEAAGALRLMVTEMEDRYKLLATAGMRKIDDYNEWITERESQKELSPVMEDAELEQIPKEKDPHHRLPYIVVIVDELADLMMVSANEVESSICRLAQMARGVGIHLVIATQRPSVDVITGVIKANLPSRIAFQVSSKIDSRTILDGSGAEALLGKGDMLYNPYNVNKPVRVQGCFLSGSEVAKVVAHVKNQADPIFDPRFTSIPTGEPSGASDRMDGEDFSDVDDQVYEEALRVVISAGQGSTSVLQRRLKLGFGRASRLLDRMEAEGIIGPAEHNRPRKLLIDPDQYSDSSPDSAPSA
jgi:S-DNA-T family DNA segregation ATPase FtsK/SpoIIIE